MQLYQQLKELKVLLFWEIIETQNSLLLDKSYSADNIYSQEQKDEALRTWSELYDEYFLLENDAVVKAVLRENMEIMRSLNVINHLCGCVEYLMFLCNSSSLMTAETFDESVQLVYSAIKKTEPRVSINYFGKIEKNIEMTERVIKSLRNSFQIKHKRNEKEVVQAKANVYTAVAEVVEILKVQININEMVVPEWVAYKQLAKRKGVRKTESDGR